MSSTPYESATLLIRLYELRREETMREARNWFAREFNPNSIDDVMAALMGPNSGHFRMVTSYWDMVASFVLNGAIDEQMFNDASGEQIGVFAKMEPFLAEYRNRMGNQRYMVNSSKWSCGVLVRRSSSREFASGSSSARRRRRSS